METFRSRPASAGRARARYLASSFGRELRLARMTAGLTQSELGRVAGLSQQQASQAELGAGDVSLEARCRLAAASGHELGWRLYPVGTVRLRDSGQLAIAQTITDAAHPGWRAQLEVPVAPDDRRAADLVVTSAVEIIHIEIERALVDLQAQLRSAQLKREALGVSRQQPVRLVMAVPDTRSARTKLAPFAELIARALPAPSAGVWRALRSGEPLGSDGILFVRSRRRG